MRLLISIIRRKKSRCTGEKPVCAICARLGQTCRYNESLSSDLAISSYANALQQQNTGLAARVALLESRLSLLSTSGNEGGSLFGIGGNAAQRPNTAGSLEDGSVRSIGNNGINRFVCTLTGRVSRRLTKSVASSFQCSTKRHCNP
jgi:hypothetical protein